MQRFELLIEQNQLIGEIGQQITDVALTEATINATKEVNKNHPTLTGKARDEAIQAEINQSGWGVGGDNRRIVEAGAALVQGLANGDVSKAVANASAPYIANCIGQHIEDDKAKVAAHGIANVALALAKGENAGAQSLGAMTAEAVGMLSKELYGKDPSKLTEDEKATVSAFATLAASIAGGLVGGDTSSAATAAQAGKTTVENNALGNKNEKPGQIYSINPLPNGALDANGDPMVVGGGIGKGSIKAPGKDSGKEATSKGSGAENAATYPKLKGDLVQQNLNNIAKQDPRLAIAINGDGSGKKDFSMGSGSRSEADKLGQIWVGDGARQTSQGGWISVDGTRGYRPASEKPNSSYATTGTQANFETYIINSKGEASKIGNGHLNITD